MKKLFLCILLLISPVSCSSSNTQNSLSGTEAGNPSIIVLGRAITGTVPSVFPPLTPSSFLSTKAATTFCLFSKVVATNELNATTSASVQEDCSFDLTVEPEHLYKIRFETTDGTAYDLAVDNNGWPLSPYFVVSSSETPIDLGNITFDGTQATPEFEPSQQNDQDSDGISDYDDTDDDGDGVADEDEQDCDLDGLPDDFDADTASCLGTETPETDLPIDTDGDGLIDEQDNCPSVSNPDQEDFDEDGLGDACDEACPYGGNASGMC